VESSEANWLWPSGGHSELPPVEVHCHGFGDVDFSDFTKVDLDRLEEWCAREGVLSLPTMYLHRSQLAEFEAFVREYHRMRGDGRLQHIAGIALEGPLLASHGGTPAATVWAPTRHEWERLAALGPYGLMYTVVSPDAFSPASELTGQPGAQETGFDWIVPLLMAHGIRPALGHFTRADPAASAELVDEIAELAWQAEWAGNGVRVVTDHLFNDMPLNIRHAFRTSRARAERDAVIASYDLPSWTLDRMAEIAGPVPAAIMRQAAAGRIGACINFDGEHVDLAIAARAVQLMGAENSMMMTDRCDSARLGGQGLHHIEDNGLWYQQDGIVAAGSVPLARQQANALSQGLTPAEVQALVAGTAHRVFGISAMKDLRLPTA
jgi:N-acetylglucosamine-6-phosphate deacetylase